MSTGGVYHQSIASQLETPVPDLHKIGGTENASIPSKRIPPQYLSEWEGFETQAVDFIRRLKDPYRNATSGSIEDLTVPRVDAPQHYLVGQEDSLKGKFTSLIAESLNRIVIAAADLIDIATELAMLRFGDSKCLDDSIFTYGGPDMVIVKLRRSNAVSLRSVIDLKPYWTCDLDGMPINGDNEDKHNLANKLGRLCNYMNIGRLKYGVFTTYRATVFVKRVDLTEFQVTRVIHHDAKDPSLRECFLYLMNLVANDHAFDQELPPEELFRNPLSERSSRNIQSPRELEKDSSEHPSSSSDKQDPGTPGGNRGGIVYRYHTGANGATEVHEEQIDGSTSIITDQEGSILGLFKTQSQLGERVFRGDFITPEKKVAAVMKVFSGTDSIYWFHIEAGATDIMSGSPCTPKLFASGITKGSFNTPGGHVVVKAFCPGERIADDVWDSWNHTSDDPILEAIKEGLEEFRKRDLVIRDLTRRDVVWDHEARQIYFIDLESCDGWYKEHFPGLTIRFELRQLMPGYGR
ncbi:hypothetical protein TWF696_006931 [Orbilia brochopaga]|uniref:Fungal-type protein kinase domain-containing protein n=1 Tax=Orbilia brochopaga TaxID=3140254 RepID=A0AAV9UQD2_9PEZI